MREIAGQSGLNYVTLYRLIDGKVTPRPWTLRRLEAWLAEPGESAIAARFRDDLRRLLGTLPARDRRKVAREIAAVVERGFRACHKEVPEWVAAMVKERVK
jgi:predicted DNA-binding transcriptional regulator AlpA